VRSTQDLSKRLVATFSAMNEVPHVMSWPEWVRGGVFTGSAGERVFYRVDGAGPTLLFAHGFPTSSVGPAPSTR